MLKKLNLFLTVVLSVTIFLVACSPAAEPTAAPVEMVQPTMIPAATDAALPDGSAIKVGLVAGSEGMSDQAFNQLAWQGIQKAAADMDFQVKFLETNQPGDYETNIDALAADGYQVIITVGEKMGEATLRKAKQYPDIKFAIIDYTFQEVGLNNLTSLTFAEEQIGFLAGVLAGGMSGSGFVCSISSLRTPQSDRYVISFRGGAEWQAGSQMRIMNNYINIITTEANVPTFDDAMQGKETALRLINDDCDVVFAVGGDAVNGVLLAAMENNLPAIGSDVDEYNIYPEAQPALISSAMKNVDVAVYNYLRSVADGSVQGGIRTGTLQNGGVGLASFHDWDDKIPDDLKIRIQQASAGIQDGSITIDLP